MITLILATTGEALLNLIIVCLFAIPTGLGLGIGFYWSKRLTGRLRHIKKVEADHKDLIEDFVKPETKKVSV